MEVPYLPMETKRGGMIMGMLDIFKSSRKERAIAKRDEDLFGIRTAFFEVIDHQNILTDTIKVLMAMADKQKFIYMWLKDSEDRYIFASENTRQKLFNNKHISKIINRTDAEISTGKKIHECQDIDLSNLTPETLVDIAQHIDDDTLICNLTDVITRQFNKPCKFIEVINDMVWIVWKEPLFTNGEYSGSVGYALDMTSQREEVYEIIEERKQNGAAFRIDSTDCYYLTEYKFPELRPRRFI